MDEETRSAWKQFMLGPGGKDLLARFIANEQTFIAKALKAKTIEEKGIEMAKMEAIYLFRAGILDIVESKTNSKTPKR